MYDRWNLDKMYHGFSDPSFASDMQKLQKTAEDFSALVATLELTASVRNGVLLLEAFTATFAKLAEYCSLVQAADTKNTEAASKLGQIIAIYSGMQGPIASFQKYISTLPDEEIKALTEMDEVLGAYKFMFSQIKEDSKYLLDAKCEEIIARMSMSGGNAWSDLQSYLTSTVPVEYEGKIINLSSVRNLAYDKDPEVRKKAYEAELKCYDRIKDAVAFALNSIKLETITETKLRGYESPLDKTLKGSRMKRETLDAMMSAMEEYMPVFRDYLKAKARALGHKNGLPWYDLFAPMGKSGKTYTVEEAKAYLLDLFGTFDKELRDMVERAFDEEWIDFFPRDGKQGGAFCSGVESLGESRILTNYDGSFSDIVTLAHELGHAFHNQCISDHRVLNRDYSMPVAETASTFNECVVMNAAIKAATDKDEKLALIESQLMDATQIICDIYSRFTFEKSVFDNREQQFTSADDLCAFMIEAQKKSYGDGLDENVRHPYMWVCKGHYYGPIFYNFPYAFGGLFARGLYAQYEREGEAFLPKYKKLLHDTTVTTVEGAALIADIDLTDRKFWESGLQSIADQIKEFIELVEA